MSSRGKEFIGVVPPKDKRPRAAFFNGAGTSSILRDQLTITTWLSLGAIAQGALFLLFGRLALTPALALLLYRAFTAYAMSVGFIHNTYLDGVIQQKIAAHIPDETGSYGSTPASSDLVVFLIGTRCNHPLGALAPGFAEISKDFLDLTQELEDHADEFGFLGMTSWLNASDRTTGSEILSIGYFRNVDGLHRFAHSATHRDAWDRWNKKVKGRPHLSIFHETYHVPAGHWESVAVNSHASGVHSLTSKFVDEETGEERWASPIVDASKGLLKTSAGRMNRSRLADEHEKYGY